MNYIRNSAVSEEFQLIFNAITDTHVLWKYMNDYKLHKTKLYVDSYGKKYFKVNNRQYFLREVSYMTPSCSPRANSFIIFYIRNGEQLIPLVTFNGDKDYRNVPYKLTHEQLLKQYNTYFL